MGKKKRKTASDGKQSVLLKIQQGTSLFFPKRCERGFKTKDEFYMETDFSKKTVTIGKGRNKITLNEMQVVLLAKQIRKMSNEKSKWCQILTPGREVEKLERIKREWEKEGVDREKMLRTTMHFLEIMKSEEYSLHEAKMIVDDMAHILEVSGRYSPQTVLANIPLRGIADRFLERG